MSEVAITVRKAVPIVVVTWILSLITTLVFVYADPSLFQLQASYGQDQHHTKIIRFHEPSEKNVTGMLVWRDDVAVFVWTPTDSTSNAILEVYVYLEYYYENPPTHAWDWEGAFDWKLNFYLSINEFGQAPQPYIRKSASSETQWEQGAYEWTQTCFKLEQLQSMWANPLWVIPNQHNYTLTFGVTHTDGASATTPTFVRNINVVIEVIDGIPVA